MTSFLESSSVTSDAKLKTTFLLWVLVAASALAVIYVTHIARNAFVESQVLVSETQQYEVEWGRLLIEQSNSASITRVEDIASDKLKMAVPDAKRVVVLKEGLK